jgi:hypothetical protein
MATNIERDEWKTYYRSVVVTNPTTPAAGDPVRWGYLTGIALIDEATDIAGETSVNFGPFEARLLVDDNVGGGIAVNALLYYNDTATGTPATNINNTATGYFYGFAAEAIGANATETIRVIHVPSPGTGALTAGGVGEAQLADDAVTTAKILDANVTTAKIADVNVTTGKIANLAVTPAKLGNGYRALANDAALTLAATDTVIVVNTTAANKAATMTATHAGHVIHVRAAVASGGSYTLAVTGGDVTLNAANEAATIVYSGSAWILVALMGATLV